MSDQGKWFKLWESALDDADLENMSVHQWYCWARFGVYLKKHGNGGKLTLRNPATALINIMRLSSFEEVIKMIGSFPNYTIKREEIVTPNVTNATVTYFVICKYWNKYQGDFSGDRVKKYRSRVTANVTPQEERRREVTPTSTSPSAARLALDAPPLAEKRPETEKMTWPQNTIGDLPKQERMTAEEMRAIRLKNLGP